MNDQASEEDLITQDIDDRTNSVFDDRTISVAWTRSPARRRREIILGEGDSPATTRPMRVEAQRAFTAAYAKANSWLDRLVADPAISVASIAARERRTERSIRQTLSLALLDPSLVEAAIREFTRAMWSDVGNMPPLPGVFPDYFAPIVRNGAEGRELVMARWGMPSPF